MSIEGKLSDLVSANELDAAISLAAQHLGSKPADLPVRLALIDLLIVTQDFERADKHADAAAKLSPKDAVGLARLRNRMRGMFARRAWLTEGASPSFPLGPTECDQAALKLALALRDGSAAEIAALLAAFEEKRGERPARWNDAEISDLRDLDDRTPHAIEAITDGGAYLWVDLSLVRSLAFEAPSRPRDLAYRRARLELTDGSAADVLVPAIYPAAPDAKPAIALGRKTDWVDGPGGVVLGQGLRCFLAGDEMRSIFEAESVDFEPAMANANG